MSWMRPLAVVKWTIPNEWYERRFNRVSLPSDAYVSCRLIDICITIASCCRLPSGTSHLRTEQTRERQPWLAAPKPAQRPRGLGIYLFSSECSGMVSRRSSCRGWNLRSSFAIFTTLWGLRRTSLVKPDSRKFLEHMHFKGTKKFPRGHLDALTFLAGGHSNAETGEDLTHYWFALPSTRWELALEIESDRMRDAHFAREDVEAERGVIAEERAHDMDTPQGRLEQMHLELSYLEHPYRNPILGWPKDVLTLDASDLANFQRRYYRPDGAVFVAAGAIDPDRALDRIEAAFGDLQSGRLRQADLGFTEPPQTGRREFRLHEAEGVGKGLFGWRAVPLRHPDLPALDILAGILGVGWRARLWEELVERRRLATWVEACSSPSRQAGQFLIQVEFGGDVEPERIEDSIRSTINELCRHGPTPIEMARCRTRIESAWRWEREDPVGLASGLGPVSLWDDWRCWQEEHKAALGVRAEDVARVASQYLNDENLTVGWLLPKSERRLARTAEPIHVELDDPSTEAPAVDARADDWFSTSVLELSKVPLPGCEDHHEDVARLRDFKPLRARLENGMRVISERRAGSGVVAIELGIDSGMLHEAKPGVAHLTSRLLEEGTQARSARQLAEAIEDIGGSLDISSSRISLRVRGEDLEPAIELLADLVRRPAFPEEELVWAKRWTINELSADSEDPAHVADQVFMQMVYGSHPYGRDARGTPAQTAKLTLADVKRHHALLYRPEGAILTAVGDFSTRAMRTCVRRCFGDWSNQNPIPPPLPRPSMAETGRTKRIRRAGRQVQVVIGHLGVTRDDRDHDALLVLDHVLGCGTGFSDRLSRILREELGLVYHVGGSITDTADRIEGVFRVSLATRPADAKRAIDVVIDQIEQMQRGEFSDDEVELARRHLASSWVFDFQTIGQRAERLFELERWRLPLEHPLHWPGRLARISAKRVRAAAARKLHPEALVRVELGPVSRRGVGG